MAEPTTTAMDADELRLAQLATAKLARLVQGTVSIGLPALITGVPDPHSFLEDQFRVMNSLGIVLHTVSGKPGIQEEIHQLRQQAREVMAALDNLRDRLLQHNSSSTLELLAAREAAATLCEAIREYAHLVRLDPAQITKVKNVVLQVFEGMKTLTTLHESSAG